MDWVNSGINWEALLFLISVCTGSQNGTTGTIHSPGWPNDYPNNVNCEWNITTDPGSLLHIGFTAFSVEDGGSNCVYDRVEIRCIGIICKLPLMKGG